jgi:hypothetical protein
MSFVRGKDAQVWITDSGGTQREVSAFADQAESTLESDILDTTTFGSSFKSAIRGYLGFSGSLQGKYDQSGTFSPDVWFVGLINAASTVVSTLTLAPSGSVASTPYERAAVFFSNYKKSIPVDNIVTWTCDYQLANGSVTRATF